MHGLRVMLKDKIAFRGETAINKADQAGHPAMSGDTSALQKLARNCARPTITDFQIFNLGVTLAAGPLGRVFAVLRGM